jgi:hypothetical protein
MYNKSSPYPSHIKIRHSTSSDLCILYERSPTRFALGMTRMRFALWITRMRFALGMTPTRFALGFCAWRQLNTSRISQIDHDLDFRDYIPYNCTALIGGQIT